MSLLRLAVRLLLSVMMVGAATKDVVRADDAARGVEFFEKKIRPLLVKHCYECHGPAEASAKLRLDSRAGWEKGGNGGPAIVPGDPSASLLIRAVSHRDPQLKMPPKEAGGKLSDAQIADLTTWIRQGAHDPRTGTKIVTDIEAAAERHWAFQPIAPPAIKANAHPIDFLIERKLCENNLVATEPADMQTLVRRTTFDLIGLPPTEKQLATAREDYPKLVQELLASPRYGERWGRHWLDVARYSDAKDGVLMYGDARIRPFAYTYRDYVIRAFNDDKPFDQFIREQLAADRLKLPEDSADLAALGLLTLGRMFDSNRHDVIDDQIDVVSRGFLGLTISCARCHDHKFDPIPTADYYSLYGVFASCIEPLERPRIAPVTEAGKAFEQEFAGKLKEVYDQQQAHYDSTLKTARERTPDYLVQVATTEPDVSETTIFFLSLIPDQLRPQITKRWRQLIARRAFADDPLFSPWHDLMREPVLKPEEWKARGIDQRIIDGLVAAKPQTPAEVARAYGTIIRDVWAKNADEADPIAALLVSRDGPVWFPKRDVTVYLSRQPGDAFRGLLGQLDAIAVKHKDAAPRAMVVTDSEVLCDPVIFQRGDPSARGLPVPRRFLSALSKADRANFTDGGGRLDLANAIASRDNPLTARVWVNRVWMHHFGEPLVENPSDFGLRTKRPAQHELLDFLADFFIRNGWRTKPLHELIVTSQAYQRASRIPETSQMAKQLEADPANSLLWRANRRRLDFEQMRDTLLVASGELDETMFGRPPLITDENNRRRTVYAFVERQNIPAMVQNFDFANADTSTPRRVMTTVPQQALFAMNSNFVLGRAKALANRPTKTEAANPITNVYLAVYGREPTAEELAWCNEFRQAGSLEQLSQVLLMSNELMFVD
ncbi:MAG: PSD1 and planctomycete cytochrome C domain-containing protein [Planctomycetota bacterium]|nr:PSD1 and planctomycete cytochrome C domain-containing protein [Planctomycetota bacterium]